MKSFVFLFLFLNFVMSAQKDDIEIVEERSPNQIKLFGVNNTSEELELTFNLDIIGFTTEEKLPVKSVLKPGQKQFLVTLTAPKGVQCQYNSSISYKKLKKNNPNTSATNHKKTTGVQINPSKINVFTMDGCARCEYVINYLKEKKIPFLELNTTFHLPNNDLMFEKLREAGFKGENVRMPVVVYKNKVDYNIKDLQEFVKGLK